MKKQKKKTCTTVSDTDLGSGCHLDFRNHSSALLNGKKLCLSCENDVLAAHMLGRDEREKEVCTTLAVTDLIVFSPENTNRGSCTLTVSPLYLTIHCK